MQNPGKYREAINNLQTILFSQFGFYLRDSVSGFRGYSREFANIILEQSKAPGFGIATEEIILAYLNDTTLEVMPLDYAKPRKYFTRSQKLAEVIEGIILHDKELKQKGFQKLIHSLKSIKAQIEINSSPIQINLNGKIFEFTYNEGSYTS